MDKKYLVVAGLLTHNRCELLERTLQSFCIQFKDYLLDMKFVIFDNGSSKEYRERNIDIAAKFGCDFYELGKEVELPEDNELRDKNISLGHKALMQIMQKYNGEAYLILEDDWECTGAVDLKTLVNFLNDNEEFGQIRLRNCKYDGTPRDCSNTNFVTKERIVWSRKHEIKDLRLLVGNLHWVNNPSLISRKALQFISKGFEGEVKCMEEFHKFYPNNLQLDPGIFVHIGPWRRRDDLIRKGYVVEDNRNE